MGNSESELVSTRAKIAVALGSSLLGLGTAAAVGTEAGAVAAGISNPILTRLYTLSREVSQRLNARLILFMTTAEGVYADQSTDDLVVKTLEDDGRIHLLQCALDGVVASSDQRKIRALGRAYAEGVLSESDDEVSNCTRIVSALSTIDPIDIMVLDAMRVPGPGWHRRRNSDDNIRRIIIEAVPAASTVVDSVTARLSNLGLITDSHDSSGMNWNGSAWGITKFGRLCCEALLDIGNEDAIDADGEQ